MIYPSREQPRWKKIKYGSSPLPFIADFSLGNGTMYKLISFKTHSRLFVGLEGIGCFLFDTENWKHPNYVAQKLYLDQKSSDCKNIADWLNVQLGKEVEEFGDYRYFEDEDYISPWSKSAMEPKYE